MPTKQKSKFSIFIEKRNDGLAYITIGTTIIVFLFVLIRTIIFPGYTICDTKDNCPNKDPVIPDLPTLIVVIIFYFLPLLFGFALVISPGALMDHPFRNKLLAMFSLFLISWSTIQLVSPMFYRYYVVPYSFVQDYNINITSTSVGDGNFTIGNLSSPLLQIEFTSVYSLPQFYAAVSVFLVSETINTPYLLPPIGTTIVYEDEDFNSITIVNSTQLINRIITGLLDNNYYLFIVDYVKAQADSTTITKLEALLNVNTDLLNTTTLPQTIQNDISSNAINSIYIDFRAYIHCKWTTNGCISTT